jgi:hypothetical protein
MVDIEDLGFKYTIFSDFGHKAKLSSQDYTRLGFPILRFEHAMVTDKLISTLSKRFDDGIGDVLKSAFLARSNGGSARIATFHGTNLFYLFELDRCVHEDNARSCLNVLVQFELFSDYLSFFVEIGGIRVRLGIDSKGALTTQFDAAEQGAVPLFKIEGKRGGWFTISWREHFLSAESGGKLAFDRMTADQWESFSAIYDPPRAEVRNYAENSFRADKTRYEGAF